MATITQDMSKLPRAILERVVRRLQDEDAARLALAQVEQAKVKKFYDEQVSTGTTKNGIGPISCAMIPYYQGYFRRRHGDKCFEDEAWVKWVLKNDERFRVKEVGTRMQVGYSAQSSRSMFHKRYSK